MRDRRFPPLHRVLMATAAFLAIVFANAAANAATPEQKCQDAVSKSGLKYFAAAYKALATCEGLRSDESIPQHRDLWRQGRRRSAWFWPFARAFTD